MFHFAQLKLINRSPIEVYVDTHFTGVKLSCWAIGLTQIARDSGSSAKKTQRFAFSSDDLRDVRRPLIRPSGWNLENPDLPGTGIDELQKNSTDLNHSSGNQTPPKKRVKIHSS